MHKEQSFRRTYGQRLNEAIHTAFTLAGRQPGARAAYEQLLRQVRLRTRLLRPAQDPRRLGRCTISAGLLALALHHADWLRPVGSWAPPPANPTPQFASLARHLFAIYPMPAFMTSAWFQAPPGVPHPEQAWYKHLGRGGSIRTAGLPLPLTRAMAHHFGQAPDHYTVPAALRWGQVLGLGGSPALARAAVATRLGREFGNEDFWLTVLQFFVRHPGMDTAYIGPVVDFLHAQRFATRELFVPGQGIVQQGPPRPDYAVKGRTVASLLRQVEAWHRELGHDASTPARSWPRSRFGEFRHVERTEQQDNLRCWTIRELLTSRELFLEGQAMGHCVASYAADCARRRTAVWSLLLDTGHGPRRVLTVEVDPAGKTVLQARGRGNRLPRRAEREVLERWAAREGLKVAEHL